MRYAMMMRDDEVRMENANATMMLLMIFYESLLPRLQEEVGLLWFATMVIRHFDRFLPHQMTSELIFGLL